MTKLTTSQTAPHGGQIAPSPTQTTVLSYQQDFPRLWHDVRTPLRE